MLNRHVRDWISLVCLTPTVKNLNQEACKQVDFNQCAYKDIIDMQAVYFILGLL